MYYKKKTLFEIDLSDWDMDERDVFFQDLVGGYVDSKGDFDRIKICVSFLGRNYPFNASSFSIDIETNGTTFNDAFFFDDIMEYPKAHNLIETNNVFSGGYIKSIKEVFLKIASLENSRIKASIKDFSFEDLISFIVMKDALNLMVLDELKIGFIIDVVLDYIFGKSSCYSNFFENFQPFNNLHELFVSQFKIINTTEYFTAESIRNKRWGDVVYFLLLMYKEINGDDTIDLNNATVFLPLPSEVEYLEWFFNIPKIDVLNNMHPKPKFCVCGKSNYFKYSMKKLCESNIPLEF